jgi:hypothetical protein
MSSAPRNANFAVSSEHGEILQLLRLKRCCFLCLSQERELLAISQGDAQNITGLSESELAQLQHMRTLPQKSFWGFPVADQR